MRPAHHVVLGVVLACVLGLVAHRVVTPRPLSSPAALPSASISAHAPARPVESAPPLLSPDKDADQGILLARSCLALAERDPLAAMEMAIANQLQKVDSVMHQWARRDPETAKAWADSFWDDTLKARALDEIQGIQDLALNTRN